MDYELKTDNWRLGELVSLKWNDELIKKDGQKSDAYYATSGQLCKATDDTPHYRLTIAYFNKDNMI